MKTFRKEPILALIIVVLLGIVVRQQLIIKNIKAESNDFKTKLRQYQIDLIVNSLRVPSEALYYDDETIGQIAAIRQSSYEKHGTKWFLPYANVVQDAFSPSRLWSPRAPDYYPTHCGNDIKVPTQGTHGVSNIINYSFENWWLNRLLNNLASLEHIGKTGQNRGDFHLERGEFDKFVKPWVLRLTKSYNSMISLRACGVLLAANCCYDEVNDVLSAFLQESKIQMHVVKGGKTRVITDYRSEVKEAMRLNIEYGLELDGPADLREEIRQKLAEMQERKTVE